MLKMKDWEGKEYRVSDELYRLKVDKSELFGDNYKKGTPVRLIGGEGHVDEPGYHFDPNWLTVTCPTENAADFCGVKKSELELITDQKA